jgi:hypothetical protein
LEELIDAGIASFKIEGRLKDIPYVANTVGFYRRQLDAILSRKGLRRSSSGTTRLDFQPNLSKTFNRGFTDYGLTGPADSVASFDTPKSTGEFIGTVTGIEESCFTLDDTRDLHNADGICFFDRRCNLDGAVVNRVDGRKVYPRKMQGIRVGQEIYRNFDYVFTRKLTGRAAQRKIALSMRVEQAPTGLILSAADEDGNHATVQIAGVGQAARKEEAAEQIIRTRLAKLGNTIFECADLRLLMPEVRFAPVSQLNAAKRELTERLLRVREANRPRSAGGVRKNAVPFPERHLTYTGNVLNTRAEAFYRRHGVETICPAAESGLDLSGQPVMTTKFCLRKELGLCSGTAASIAEPMILLDEGGRRYEVHFRCGACGMEVFLGHKENTA